MLLNKKLSSSIFMGLTLVLSVLFTYIQPDPASAQNFGVAGDWGCSGNTEDTVDEIRSHNAPEKVFALGDYSYTSTPTCWLNIIDPIKSRTRIAIGNHEDDSDEGYSQYLSAFNLPTTYQAFTFGNARIIIMDTDHFSYNPGSNQYNFVISQLQQASQNSAYKWIIVYFHKEMYTSPNTCSAGSCSNTNSEISNLRNIWHPKFDQYGVDMVFMGHVHNYQRTFPIRYDSGSPSSPIVTSTASQDYNDPTGEIFVLVGTGGVNIHGLSDRASWVKYQQDDKFGAVDLSIENNGYTLAGRYYTNDGVKRDVFKITKTGTAQYSFGPSLALSGEETTTSLTPSGDDSLTKNNLDTGNLGQPNGLGKGLSCEHFKQLGPIRCR
jgi:predicted phosphodiesterase